MVFIIKVFFFEGKGLKLDMVEDLEFYIVEFCVMEDVEEVYLFGNIFGVGVCKLFGEVFVIKKILCVCFFFLFFLLFICQFQVIELIICDLGC